jgi:hypothetical protein
MDENILDDEDDADSYIFHRLIVGSIQDSLPNLKSAESYFSIDEEDGYFSSQSDEKFNK